MQNQFELETASVRLYKYLCEEVVGSENIVRYRRLYYKLHDDMMDILNVFHLEYISSGSRAEGLDLPGSDFDFMVLWALWAVYEDQPKNEEDILILDIQNALPGFALLKKSDSSSFPFSSTTTAYGNLILNSELCMNTWKTFEQERQFAEVHGPCVSNSFLIDIDILNCLKCHSWPTVARNWLFRSRPSGWPSTDIVSKIVSQGCLLVPVGSKSSGSDGNPFEWRFSFSLSEKLLVHSFNHTQLLCYALLKIWLKEILNTDKMINNKLCSYFMKTVLFWILEEDENLNWIPQNLLHCFHLCIDRLHYWIVCGYLPNYFIPEHNMIDGKLSRDDLANLSLFLDKINMRQNWKVMLSVPSLRNFWNLPVVIQRNPHRLNEFDQAVLSLQTFGSLMLDVLNYCRGDGVSACIIYRLIHKHLPISAKKILILMFLKENKNILAYLNNVNLPNRQGYLPYKEFLSRSLMSTSYDSETGWLLLSSFFYSTHNHHKMPCILHLLSSLYSLKNHFVQNDVHIQSFKDISTLKKIVYSGSFVKRMRYEISRVFHIDFNGLMTDIYPFLNEDIPRLGTVGGLQSYSLFFFLKFLYYRKQRNSIETESVLHLLKTIVEEESDRSKNVLCIFASFTLLSKAFELSNDDEGYQTCALHFLKAIKKSNQFEAYMKYTQADDEMTMAFELI